MNLSSSQSDSDAVCRAHYLFIARECREKGLDPSEVERSARELSHSIETIYYLKSTAYKPTGIALGCPLPDELVTRQLRRLSRQVENRLAEMSPGEKPTFAYVPRDWYHITLVNRSHFDVTEVTEFTYMTGDEKELAEDLIEQTGRFPIVLNINGLILTSSGRLIVPGFPKNDRMYQLRDSLTKALPQLHTNVPLTAHIKLGHVLVHLKKDKLNMLLDWLDVCGERVSAHMIFRDAYTPAGRIIL